MALRQVVLSKKVKQKRDALEALAAAEEALKETEAQLEVALDEAQTDEDIVAVEAKIEVLEGEKEKLDDQMDELESEIADLEKELDDLERSAPKPSAKRSNESQRNGGVLYMERRFNLRMPPERRDAYAQRREVYLQRSDVRAFYERVRDMITQNRAIKGSDLLIPDVTLELIRDNLDGYSKLLKHVYLKPVKGTARQTISGEIPEAIWTEMYGKLNEMEFDFSQIEVDGYKVGGFIPVSNAILKDSYINLAAEIEYMLSEAIGYAVDKAIIYGLGTGKKMPQGFVTRLADTRADEDLSDANIVTIDGTTKKGIGLFQEILRGVGKIKANKVKNPITFLMNQQTWNVLVMPESLSVNSAGTMVAAANDTFPVLGGNIEFLDFIPYGDIVGGYLEKYLLVEREGAELAVSEHVRFLSDETVFKGTARYDGKPVRPAAFFAMNICGQEPTTEVAFAPDTVNP